MANLLSRLFGRTTTPSSSAMAKSRLQVILVHDRLNLAPERMQQMKAELLAVLNKYIAVDGDKADFALERRERAAVLVAEVPFTQLLGGHDDGDEDHVPTRGPLRLEYLADDEHSAPTTRSNTFAPDGV